MQLQRLLLIRRNGKNLLGTQHTFISVSLCRIFFFFFICRLDDRLIAILSAINPNDP